MNRSALSSAESPAPAEVEYYKDGQRFLKFTEFRKGARPMYFPYQPPLSPEEKKNQKAWKDLLWTCFQNMIKQHQAFRANMFMMDIQARSIALKNKREQEAQQNQNQVYYNPMYDLMMIMLISNFYSSLPQPSEKIEKDSK